MAEDKKPAKPAPDERPEARHFPPPGPEVIVKLGAGPDKRPRVN